MILPRRMMETGAILIVSLVVLKLTKQISAPILLALVLGVILSPLLDWGARRSIPSAATAMAVTIATCVMIGLFGLFLAPAVEKVAHRIPQITYELRNSLDQLMAFGEDIEQASKEVSKAIGNGEASGGSQPPRCRR